MPDFHGRRYGCWKFCCCFKRLRIPGTATTTRHDLHEMLLTIALLPTLGGEGCVDMELFGQAKEPFLRRFLRLEHGPEPRPDQRAGWDDDFLLDMVRAAQQVM